MSAMTTDISTAFPVVMYPKHLPWIKNNHLADMDF